MRCCIVRMIETGIVRGRLSGGWRGIYIEGPFYSLANIVRIIKSRKMRWGNVTLFHFYVLNSSVFYCDSECKHCDLI